MTEAEWNACVDPTPMLESLRGKASDRKLRLFAFACCRRIWILVEPWYHRLAEVGESYLDQKATMQDVQAVREATSDPDWIAGRAFDEAAALDDTSTNAAIGAAEDAAFAAADHATGFPVATEANQAWLAAQAEERISQVALLRDIIENPFRLPSAVDPSWLTCNDGAVRKLAQSIYDDRAFDHLPLLADALEDAGCTDAAILSHCRGPGDHVRGCWVVDLLLGKS